MQQQQKTKQNNQTQKQLFARMVLAPWRCTCIIRLENTPLTSDPYIHIKYNSSVP